LTKDKNRLKFGRGEFGPFERFKIPSKKKTKLRPAKYRPMMLYVLHHRNSTLPGNGDVYKLY